MANSNFDMDLMAETELIRLQRQFRIMESDRKAFTDEATQKLVQQRKEINLLENERNELFAKVKIASCENQKRRDAKLTKQIARLLDDLDKIETKTSKEKRCLDEINEQILKTSKKVESLRSSDVSEAEYVNRIKSGRTSIKTLEDRLDTHVKRYGQTLASNKTLRSHIEHLLKQRARFNVTWDTLNTNLNASKRDALDLIDQATVAYAARDELGAKLGALSARTHNDALTHARDAREMQRLLDGVGVLGEFLGVKGQRRVMRALEEREKKLRDEERETEAKQHTWYADTMRKIKEFCGEEDVVRIATWYTKQEEENFALFSYVNEVKHEVDELKAKIDDLDEKIGEDHHTEIYEEDDRCDRELEVELDEAKQEADEEEKRVLVLESKVTKVLAEIHEIFQLLSFEASPILALICDNAGGVNAKNFNIYLGLIQKKVSSLMTSTYFNEKSVSLVCSEYYFVLIPSK